MKNYTQVYVKNSTEESVQRAFDVLRDGGVVIEAIHELLWSKCCATVIDKYGVCWWIAI